MKLKYVFVLMVASITLNSYGQLNREGELIEETNSLDYGRHKFGLVFNYFGELILHPGIEIGTDYSIGGPKWVNVHWNTSIGGYWHRWNNTSVFAKTSIGARFPISSFLVDLNVGVGYMHSFLAGDVYGPSENGGIEKVKNLGTSHFMPNFSLLFGWDGMLKKKLPWIVNVGPEVYLQSSYNHIFLPHLAIKVGIVYKLK